MQNNYLANYELPPFPNPVDADDEGLLCYGGDLSVERLLSAYSSGIFPWFNEDDPILWWSPNPRFVLFPQDLHISKSLKRTIKKNLFEIKYDTAFVQVMIECANAKRPDTEGTWIVPEMIESYSELHKAGFAHSFEAWYDGELVGGGYGVAIGDIFCGESMFAKKSDASKVAFVHLVERLKSNGFSLIDSQIHTDYLEKFGAVHISRDEYLIKVKEALLKPKKF
jgi:leucyl/phenylalanyl-tRNA--protein transferase